MAEYIPEFELSKKIVNIDGKVIEKTTIFPNYIYTPDLEESDEFIKVLEEAVPAEVSPSKAVSTSSENSEVAEAAKRIKSQVDTLPPSLSEDLKKILKYLDSLLEELPEEKIREFAYSEYYDIYNKLFDELGI